MCACFTLWVNVCLFCSGECVLVLLSGVCACFALRVRVCACFSLGVSVCACFALGVSECVLVLFVG